MAEMLINVWFYFFRIIPFSSVKVEAEVSRRVKELFYSLFEDFREKLVYAKVDQLKTFSSIPQTSFCVSSSFRIISFKKFYYFQASVKNAHENCFGCHGSINYWRPFCCSRRKNLIARSWSETPSSVSWLESTTSRLISRITPNNENGRIKWHNWPILLQF